jgi:hypothetical protein
MYIYGLHLALNVKDYYPARIVFSKKVVPLPASFVAISAPMTTKERPLKTLPNHYLYGVI